MRIKVISGGKLKDPAARELVDRYAKRLPSFVRLEWVEVKPGTSPDPEARKKEEAKRIKKCLPARAFVVALDEHGEQLSSRELASLLSRAKEQGRELCLLIGGPEGLEPGLVREADFQLSLSRLTFPHELVRVILAEQLYRAFSILENKPYHRG